MRTRFLYAPIVAGCSFTVELDSLRAVPEGGSAAADAAEASADAVLDATSPPDVMEAGVECPQLAFFCDGFEMGFTPWSKVSKSQSGAVFADGVPPHGPRFGAAAMRASASMNPPDDAGMIRTTAAHAARFITPKSSGRLGIRAYVLLPQALATDTTFVKVLHQMSSTYPEDMSAKGGPSGRLRINTDNGVALNVKHDSFVAMPVGKWFCFEWVIDIGANGRQAAYVDGQMYVDAPVDTVGSMMAGYDEVDFGFTAASGMIVQSVLFDGVVLAHDRAGCL